MHMQMRRHTHNAKHLRTRGQTRSPKNVEECPTYCYRVRMHFCTLVIIADRLSIGLREMMQSSPDVMSQ